MLERKQGLLSGLQEHKGLQQYKIKYNLLIQLDSYGFIITVCTILLETANVPTLKRAQTNILMFSARPLGLLMPIPRNYLQI